MKQWKSWLSVAVLGAFCVFLSAPQAHAAKHKKSKKHSGESVQPSQESPSTSQGDDYVNIGKAGFGPSWDSVLAPSNAATVSSTQLGTIDGRYWVNREFGFDGGFGLGFPEISPNNETLISLRAEGMVALKETRHNIFYADAEILPAFISGSGPSGSLLAFQGGLGLEHAMSEMPNLSVYTEWEPLSIDVYSPGGGASSATGFGFFGSVMNFTMGLRYYF